MSENTTAMDMGQLASEFATVRLSIDITANGPRLRIEDLRLGTVGFLDPLELASLIQVRHEALAPFLDPGATAWIG